ncbi:hypothetical protein IAT38_002251 [Cryptococcus sp. DSM 104549]
MLWRFSFASNSTLDALLAREIPPSLEELMDEQDILSECKAQNNRLITFLSREDSAKSLLQWVVAGLDELDQQAALADSECLSYAITSPDLYPSYQAPASLLVPGTGPGSPPLEPVKFGQEGALGAEGSAPGEGDDGTEENGEVKEEVGGDLEVPGLGQGLRRKSEGEEDVLRSKYPTTATEILTCPDIWSVVDTVMRNADTLLTPFWNAVLPPIEPSTPTTAGSAATASTIATARQEAGERERARKEFWSDEDEERDRRREMIRGLWIRVNTGLLSRRPQDMIRFIQTLPNIVERIVAQISSPAIQNLLIAIITSEQGGITGTIDWLASEGLVPRLLDLLSPHYPPSIHEIVSDLIKTTTTLCAPSPFNPHGGNAEQQAGQGQAGGRDNRLIRELVSEQSVDIMVGHMLDEVELSDEGWKGINEDGEPSPVDPFIVHPLPSVASATSSIVNICTVLVEIIRRNNSDFSEPHLFHTLRNRLMSVRMQDDMDSREAAARARDGEGQEETEETEQEKDEKERRHMEEALVDMSSRMGIVHLGHLLDVISDRFDRLQRLVLHPRSQDRAAFASNPKPFTLERFRIIELCAELLHSSNMSILNRAPGTGPTYTEEGILSGGLEGLEALGEAIDGDHADQDEGRREEDQVTPAKELPVSSGSTDASLTGSDDVESEDEDVLDAIANETTPSPSPGASTIFEPSVTGGATGEPAPPPPPPSQEVADRLRGVMETESKPPASSAASDVPSAISRVAVATSTAAPSIASDTPEPDPRSTSSHPSNLARPPPAVVLAPGDKLKKVYLQYRVVPTVVDLFFEYPENNFMHHVVYDILQQVLNGRLGPGPNRELVVALLKEARLVERILDVQRLNDRMVANPKTPRLACMGHIILICEELVKFFSRCPPDLFALIQDTFVLSEWEAFVDTTLRETKARDDRPLAGGKPMPTGPPGGQAPDDDSGSDDDDDDDVGMGAGSGGMRFGEPLTRTAAKDGFAPRGEFDAYADHDENGDGEDNDEQMDRYWKTSGVGLSRRHADSSDDDDEDADWLRPAANAGWGSSGGDDDDFGAWETGPSRPAGQREQDEFEDDAWGNFTSGGPANPADDPFRDDNFAPNEFTPSVVRAAAARPLERRQDEPLTPLDWAEQFERAFREGGGDDEPSPGSDDGEDTVECEVEGEGEGGGERVGGTGMPGLAPIVMPNLDDDDGDDVALGMSKDMEMSVSGGTSSWTFKGDDAGVDLPPTMSPTIPGFSTSPGAVAAAPRSPERTRGASLSSVSSNDSASTSSSLSDSTITGTSPIPIPIPARQGSGSQPARGSRGTHSRSNSLSRSHGHRPHPGHPITSTSPSSRSASSASSASSSPTSPSRTQGAHRWGEAFSPPDPALIAAATEESPLGPGVSPDTRITEEGLLERQVAGGTVRVPQDEIVEAIERNADDQEEIGA